MPLGVGLWLGSLIGMIFGKAIVTGLGLAAIVGTGFGAALLVGLVAATAIFSVGYWLNKRSSMKGLFEHREITRTLKQLPGQYSYEETNDQFKSQITKDSYYSHEHIRKLARCYLSDKIDNGQVIFITPVNIDNTDALAQNILQAFNDYVNPQVRCSPNTKVMIPMNINGNHWVLLILDHPSAQSPKALYYDPMGCKDANKETNEIIKKINEVLFKDQEKKIHT